MRYAVKSAPPPGGEPLQFVMSDGSIDRMGDVIEPKGWQLANFKTHPIALFNHDRDQIIGKWVDVRVEGSKLLGRLELAAAGTSPLVDTVRALVDQNILRAVSVGFRPLEQKPLNEDADKYFGPFKFIKSELLECSLVAVPANPNALATAKSLGLPGDFLAEVFRKTAGPTPRAIPAKPGKSLVPQATKMKPLSERIEDMRNRTLVSLQQPTDRLQDSPTNPTTLGRGRAGRNRRTVRAARGQAEIARRTGQEARKAGLAARSSDTAGRAVQAPAIVRSAAARAA